MIEQIIPMLGLEMLQHTIDPPPISIPEKVLFLFENAFTHGKPLTTAISFISLFGLLLLRTAKRRLAARGGKWKSAIYLPEVFVTVVLTTGEWCVGVFRLVECGGGGG